MKINRPIAELVREPVETLAKPNPGSVQTAEHSVHYSAQGIRIERRTDNENEAPASQGRLSISISRALTARERGVWDWFWATPPTPEHVLLVELRRGRERHAFAAGVHDPTLLDGIPWMERDATRIRLDQAMALIDSARLDDAQVAVWPEEAEVRPEGLASTLGRGVRGHLEGRSRVGVIALAATIFLVGFFVFTVGLAMGVSRTSTLGRSMAGWIAMFFSASVMTVLFLRALKRQTVWIERDGLRVHSLWKETRHRLSSLEEVGLVHDGIEPSGMTLTVDVKVGPTYRVSLPSIPAGNETRFAWARPDSVESLGAAWTGLVHQFGRRVPRFSIIVTRLVPIVTMSAAAWGTYQARDDFAEIDRSMEALEDALIRSDAVEAKHELAALDEFDLGFGERGCDRHELELELTALEQKFAELKTTCFDYLAKANSCPDYRFGAVEELCSDYQDLAMAELFIATGHLDRAAARLERVKKSPHTADYAHPLLMRFAVDSGDVAGWSRARDVCIAGQGRLAQWCTDKTTPDR